jgi:hypothetical protein
MKYRPESKMRYKLLLLAALFLTGTSNAHAQSASESEAKPFNFSSRGTPFGVQGEFAGSYIVHEDSIEVTVAQAKIYVSENCPYQGPRTITQMRFGLATKTATASGESWKIESAGQPLALDLVMVPREEYSLYNLTFSIPKEAGLDLTKRWFVVAIQTDPLDAPPEKKLRGYVFASSCKDIFMSPDSQQVASKPNNKSSHCR